MFATASREEGQFNGLMDRLQIVIMALIDNLVLGYLKSDSFCSPKGRRGIGAAEDTLEGS